MLIDITLDPQGNIHIRGDQYANVVHIVYADGLFRIDADGMPTITLAVPGPLIDISLRGGPDRVIFGDEDHSFIPRQVRLDFGSGDDMFLADQNSFVSRTFSINFGAGDDMLQGEGTMLSRNAVVRMGRGEDVFELAYSTSENFLLDMGPGSDRVALLDHGFGSGATIALGQGDDELEAWGTGTPTLNGGAGTDTLIDAPDGAKIGGFEH